MRTARWRKNDLRRIEFGRRLTLSIEALGMSQAAFGRSIEAERRRVHNWLAGLAYPQPDKLLEMDLVHGLTLDWLLKGRTTSLSAELAAKIEQATGEPA